MNQLCAWLVCLGVLASVGLLIWVLVKQHDCCKNSEPFTDKRCEYCKQCAPMCKNSSDPTGHKMCMNNCVWTLSDQGDNIAGADLLPDVCSGCPNN